MGLCLEIGTTQQVATRRDITDMQELLNHIVKGLKQIIYVKIGIQRKACCSGKLTTECSAWDFSQTTMYNTRRYILILSDSSDSPYFGYHWRKYKDFFYHLDRFRIDGFLCISSAKFRECVHCGWTRQECTLHEPYESEICNLIRIRSSIHSHVFRYIKNIKKPLFRRDSLAYQKTAYALAQHCYHAR